MNPDHVMLLLANAGTPDDACRSPACPDESRLAGYVDGGLDEAGREQIGLHLADCSHCLSVVGLLSRERDADVAGTVQHELMAQARAMAKKRPLAREPQRRWWLAPQWAMAAAVVLAVPLLLQLGRDEDRGVTGQEPALSAIRARAVPASELQVLEPAAGAAVDTGRLAFRWTEVPGTPFYDVRILTDDGDVVARARVPDTSWQPPPQVVLEPGAEYFVLVDAYPAGDRALSSEHVPFRVPE